MIGRGFVRVVAGDLLRHWKHFAAASVGIILGVAALTFFLARTALILLSNGCLSTRLYKKTNAFMA